MCIVFQKFSSRSYQLKVIVLTMKYSELNRMVDVSVGSINIHIIKSC